MYPDGMNVLKCHFSPVIGARAHRPWVLASLFVSLGKMLSLIFFVDLSASSGIGCGKYYNLSADKMCTWPVAPLGEAKWLWRFSCYRNNRQQRFISSGKKRHTNADIIIIKYDRFHSFNFNNSTHTGVVVSLLLLLLLLLLPSFFFLLPSSSSSSSSSSFSSSSIGRLYMHVCTKKSKETYKQKMKKKMLQMGRYSNETFSWK